MEGILILSSFSISKSDCVLTSVLSDSFLLKFPRAGVFFWLPLSRPRGWKKVHPMQSNAVPSLYNLMSAVLHLTPWVLHCGLIMTQWICGMIPCWCSDCAPIKMRFTSCVKCRSSVGHKNDDDDEHSCCVKCSSGPRAERGGFLQKKQVFGQTWVVNRRFAESQWQEVAQRHWSNTTAGCWDPKCLLSSELGKQEHLYVRAPSRWLGGPELVCQCFSCGFLHPLCLWVTVHGSQRSQLAAADWEGPTEHRDPDCFALVAAQTRLFCQNPPKASVTFSHQRAER